MRTATSQKPRFVYYLGLVRRGIDCAHKLMEIAEFLMRLYSTSSN